MMLRAGAMRPHASTTRGGRCRRCGHDLADDVNFCDVCGAPVSDGTTTGMPELVEFADALDADEELPAAIAALRPGTGLLIVRRGPNAPSRYFLDGTLMSVGRASDAHIFLDDSTVSRRQAVIASTEGRFTIEDLGSLNGTYVDGRRVSLAPLHHLSEIRIGVYQLLVVLVEADAAASPQRRAADEAT